MKINNKSVSIFIFILIFIIYGNSLKNKYSLDDHLVNSKNELTQHGIKGIPEIFKNYSFSEKNLTYAYRPIVLTSFAIEYELFGVNPKISHFISIILYALFCILLFYFFQILFPGTPIWIKLFAIIIFIVHPIHTELVDNIKSRDELLAGLFGISILIHYLKYLNDKRIYRLIIIALFFCFGYYTKQSIFLYVGSIPFIYLIKNNKNEKLFSLIGISVGLLVLFGSLRFLKHQLLIEVHPERAYLFFENPLFNQPLPERLPTGITIGIPYLKMLFWPVDLSYYYGYNQIQITTWGDIIVYLSLIFHLFLVFLLIKNIRTNSFLSFAIFSYIINIIAVSNVFTFIPGIIGERFIFFGSIGFSMAFSVGVFNFLEEIKWYNSSIKKPLNGKIIFTLSLLVIFYSANVIARNRVWYDDFSLVSSDVAHVLKSAKAHDMYAYQLLGKIKVEKNYQKRNAYIQEGIKQCEMSLYIYPDFVTSWNNLGTLYFSKQDYQKAEICFQKVISIDSTDANPLFNLGNIYQLQLKSGLARQYYEKALNQNPDLYDLIPVYKKFVVENHKTDESIEFLVFLTEKFPNSYDLNLLLIDLYNSKNDYKNMLVYLKKANSIKPSPELSSYIEKITTFISK